MEKCKRCGFAIVCFITGGWKRDEEAKERGYCSFKCEYIHEACLNVQNILHFSTKEIEQLKSEGRA